LRLKEIQRPRWAALAETLGHLSAQLRNIPHGRVFAVSVAPVAGSAQIPPLGRQVWPVLTQVYMVGGLAAASATRQPQPAPRFLGYDTIF